MAPKQDPHNVILAIDKGMAHGADDDAYDAEGAETQQPAKPQLAADVHLDVPE